MTQPDSTASLMLRRVDLSRARHTLSAGTNTAAFRVTSISSSNTNNRYMHPRNTSSAAQQHTDVSEANHFEDHRTSPGNETTASAGAAQSQLRVRPIQLSKCRTGPELTASRIIEISDDENDVIDLTANHTPIPPPAAAAGAGSRSACPPQPMLFRSDARAELNPYTSQSHTSNHPRNTLQLPCTQHVEAHAAEDRIQPSTSTSALVSSATAASSSSATHTIAESASMISPSSTAPPSCATQDAPHTSGPSPSPVSSEPCKPSLTCSATHHRVFAFDLETTGFISQHCCILDIAVVDVTTGASFSTLVDPQRRFKKCVHGIDQKQVRGQPNVREALSEMVAFVQRMCAEAEVPVLVAHNGANFDFKILQMEARRVGVQLPASWLCLDTLKLAQQHPLNLKARAGGLKQIALINFFNLPESDIQHRALPDAQQLAALFLSLVASLPAEGGVPLGLPQADPPGRRSSSLESSSVQALGARFPGIVRLLSDSGPSGEDVAAAEAALVQTAMQGLPGYRLLSPREFAAVCVLGGAGEAALVGQRKPAGGLTFPSGLKQFLPILVPNLTDSPPAHPPPPSETQQTARQSETNSTPDGSKQAAPSRLPACLLLRSLRIDYNIGTAYSFKEDGKPTWNLTVQPTDAAALDAADFNALQKCIQDLVGKVQGTGAKQEPAAYSKMKLHLNAEVAPRASHQSAGHSVPRQWALHTGITSSLTGQDLRPRELHVAPAAGTQTAASKHDPRELHVAPAAGAQTAASKHDQRREEEARQATGPGTGPAAEQAKRGQLQPQTPEQAQAAAVMAVNAVLKRGMVVDALVWPEMVWRVDGKAGVKLRALHIFVK